ncbi:MAG: C40 family peptidase, partial [Spirochaetaceae bacterium]|nr:C40 family peptidase [Spirochaetaceae bacterium]
MSTALPVTVVAALLITATLSSCALIFGPPEPPVPAPASVRSDALTEAIRYIGMEYEWGGQDIMPRGIDCSGLVVNVYYFAAAINGYSLPFADATAAGLHESYSTLLDLPEPGDLIFMGAADDPTTTHVAIYESTVDGQMTFIDSTYIPESGINGVS